MMQPVSTAEDERCRFAELEDHECRRGDAQPAASGPCWHEARAQVRAMSGHQLDTSGAPISARAEPVAPWVAGVHEPAHLTADCGEVDLVDVLDLSPEHGVVRRRGNAHVPRLAAGGDRFAHDLSGGMGSGDVAGVHGETVDPPAGPDSEGRGGDLPPPPCPPPEGAGGR